MEVKTIFVAEWISDSFVQPLSVESTLAMPRFERQLIKKNITTMFEDQLYLHAYWYICHRLSKSAENAEKTDKKR